MVIKKVILSVLVVVAIVLYLSLLIPSIIFNNLGDFRTVKYVENVPTNLLPADIIDELKPAKDSYNVLFIEDVFGSEKWAVIPIEGGAPLGTPVRITYERIKWNIDWHDYEFMNHPSNKLIIGEIMEVSSPNPYVKMLISSPYGQTLFSISRLNYALGGLILIVFLSLILRGKLAFWNVPAILSCYSIASFMDVITPKMLSIESETSLFKLIFGMLFITLIPYTLRSYNKVD